MLFFSFLIFPTENISGTEISHKLYKMNRTDICKQKTVEYAFLQSKHEKFEYLVIKLFTDIYKINMKLTLSLIDENIKSKIESFTEYLTSFVKNRAIDIEKCNKSNLKSKVGVLIDDLYLIYIYDLYSCKFHIDYIDIKHNQNHEGWNFINLYNKEMRKILER